VRGYIYTCVHEMRTLWSLCRMESVRTKNGYPPLLFFENSQTSSTRKALRRRQKTEFFIISIGNKISIRKQLHIEPAVSALISRLSRLSCVFSLFSLCFVSVLFKEDRRFQPIKIARAQLLKMKQKKWPK
jgi:hypothetical protein